MKLSIIIPAHNEEGRIGKMLDDYLPYFSDKYGEDVEFLVVVNGSNDKTDKVVDGYKGQYPALRCIVEKRKIGKGGALMRGFAEAKGDLVGFSDADGATPATAFQDLVDKIGDSDVIVASRWCKGAQVSPKQSFSRLLASRAFNMLTRLGFGLRLTDTQCGAKLMRRDFLMQVIPELGLTQWAFDVDLLFHFKRAKAKIREVPTVWRDIAGSKISALAKTSFDMALALTRLRLIHSPFKWVVSAYDRWLAPLIRPASGEEDYLIRHSLILMVGGQFANVFNLVFQLLMVRLLAETGDYSVLMSMLGAFMIFSTPLAAMSRAVTHFAAHFIKDDQRERVFPMLMCYLRDLCLLGIPFLLLVVFYREEAASFFKLDTSTPILIVGVGFVLSLFSPMFAGVLQGAQAFFWTTAIGVITSFSRVVFAVILVLLGYAASGALTGQVLSVLLGLIISFIAVANIIGQGGLRTERVAGFYRYFLPTMFALGGYSVLMMADVAIVRHYFDPSDADLFAKAAMVARMVIFFPMPVALAMFPKVVSKGELSSDSLRILRKSIIVVACLVLTVAMACTIAPGFVARVITGSSEAGLSGLVRGMVWALSPISIVYLIVNFELAQRRFVIAIPMVISATLYFIGVLMWHESLMQIVWVLMSVSFAALVMSVVFLQMRSKN